uniref:PHP domain-containing protein n=1 Tax=Aquiluna sp. TaxID=2053504 RepID=UPI0040476777
MSFTHLNVSSAFSAHYGVNRPEQLCAAASSMGCESLAITDRDGLYGAIKHIGACISTGIAPIVGVSLEVTADKSLGRVLILAHGNNSGKGWATLCRIISKAQERKSGKKDVSIKIGDLAGFFKEETFCTILIGLESSLADAALTSRATARELATMWREYFPAPAALAIEVVNHMTEPGKLGSAQHAKAM